MAELADISDALESLASRQNRYGKYRDAVKLTQRNEVRERCANTLPRGRTTQEVARREHSINSPNRCIAILGTHRGSISQKDRILVRVLGVAGKQIPSRLWAIPLPSVPLGLCAHFRSPVVDRAYSGRASHRPSVPQSVLCQSRPSGSRVTESQREAGHFSGSQASAANTLHPWTLVRCEQHLRTKRPSIMSSLSSSRRTTPQSEIAGVERGARWPS